MKKTLRIILNFVVFPLTGLLLLFFAFRNVNLQALWNDIVNTDFLWVGISLLFAFAAFVSRAFRWTLLIEPLGYKPPVYNTVLAVIVAYFANIAMPRLGEITRCGALNKTDNIPIDKLIGTVITERVIDFLTLLLMIVIVLIIKFRQMSSFFYNQVLNPLYNNYFTSMLFWIIVLSSLTFSVLFLFFMRKKMSGFTTSQKIKDFLSGLFAGLRSVFKMKKSGLFLLHTAFIWTMYILMTYVVFFAIVPTQDLTLADGLFVMAIGGLGMAAPVQNGYGAFHTIVAYGFIYLGKTWEDGILFATICHESQTIMILLLGPVALLLIFFVKKRNQVKA